MAACAMAATRLCVFKSLLGSSTKRSCLMNYLPRQFATRTTADDEDKVVITDNGSVIVCWHPEINVPYEYSRPLPEVVEDTSVFRVSTGVVQTIMKRKTDEQVRKELMKITHTTKHRWFPKSVVSKLRKDARRVHDREYL